MLPYKSRVVLITELYSATVMELPCQQNGTMITE